MAERAARLPLPRRAQRFCCVLDDHETVLRGDREQRHHVDRVPEDVDGNDGADAPAGLPVHEFAVAASRYLVQMRIQRGRIEARAYSSSESTICGMAPAWLTALAVATNVIAGRMTSSFAWTPSSSNAA